MSVVVFAALAAFSVDLGLAYNSKRQLQTQADAGALGAASVYTDMPGTCATLAADGAAEAKAKAIADDYFAKNLWAPTTKVDTEFDVACNVDGELEVTYTPSGSTETVFGPVTGGGDSITTTRSAAAVVDVASTVRSGLRPLAFCSAELPDNGQIDGSVVRIDYPGGGHNPPATCPQPTTAGNWWLVDCPGERTGSANELADQIRNGCPDPVSVVPGQGEAETPGELAVVLEGACPSAPIGSEECLSGNPGNIGQGQTGSAWQALAQSLEPVPFPVFCAPPQCGEGTIDGGGTGAVIPVYKIAAMYVCGYHFGKNDRYQNQPATGPCSNSGINVYDDSSRDNYLVVSLTTLQTSGTTESSDCALGASCDGGLRRVHLTE